MADKPLYRISFLNQGKVYEVYARGVSHGSLMGFVEIEKLTFNNRTGVLVDPAEEKIKSEFAGVRRSFLPLHCVLRIDEVATAGVSKISAAEDGNVSPFPLPMFSQGDNSGDDQ